MTVKITVKTCTNNMRNYAENSNRTAITCTVYLLYDRQKRNVRTKEKNAHVQRECGNREVQL